MPAPVGTSALFEDGLHRGATEVIADATKQRPAAQERRLAGNGEVAVVLALSVTAQALMRL